MSGTVPGRPPGRPMEGSTMPGRCRMPGKLRNRCQAHFRPCLEALESRHVPAQVAGTALLEPASAATTAPATPGMYDPETGLWYLRSVTAEGRADVGHFLFGAEHYTPVVGDWTGSGLTGVGVVADDTWYLR